MSILFQLHVSIIHEILVNLINPIVLLLIRHKINMKYHPFGVQCCLD